LTALAGAAALSPATVAAGAETAECFSVVVTAGAFDSSALTAGDFGAVAVTAGDFGSSALTAGALGDSAVTAGDFGAVGVAPCAKTIAGLNAMTAASNNVRDMGYLY